MGGTVNAYTGTPFVIDGSRSHDTDGRIVSYEWDIDDDGVWDALTLDPSYTHTFGNGGCQFVRLRVTDDMGLTSIDRRGFHVREDKWPPIAVLETPQYAVVGESVTLDGSGSYDEKGMLDTFSWDFESDGVFDSVSTEPIVVHSWNSPGEYIVTLSVSDCAGNTDETSGRIVIELGDDPRPESPFGLVAADVPQDEGGAVRLDWQTVGEADVHSYRVYRSIESTGSFALVATVEHALNYVDTGLQDGTTYHYAVSALDDAGQESDLSSIASATPTDDLAPKTPTGLSVRDVPADQGTALVVEWQGNTEPDLAGYSLRVVDTVEMETWTIGLPADSITFTVGDLVPGRTYEFSLSARDVFGNEGDSCEPVTAVPVDDLAPDAPVGLTARDVPDDEGGSIALAWHPNPEPDLDGYVLYRALVSPGVDPLVAMAGAIPVAYVPAPDTEWVDHFAMVGSTYAYQIIAVDLAGNASTPSDVALAGSTDDLAPSPPLGITVVDVPDDQGGALAVEWIGSISVDVAGYRLVVYGPSGDTVASRDVTIPVQVVFEGLSTGSEHLVTVAAFDPSGNLSTAIEATCTPIDDLAPAAPADVTATDVIPDQGGRIVVSWTANEEPDLAGYKLRCVNESGEVVATIDTGFSTSQLFEGLVVGGSYSFTVFAFDVNGNESLPSAVVTATANDELPPDAVSVTAQDHPGDQGGVIDVTWTPSDAPDLAGYLLFRDGELIADTSATSYEDTSAGAVERTYVVRAYDESGNLSVPSEPAVAIATDDLPPATPTIMSAVDAPMDEAGTVLVTLVPVADEDLDGYLVYAYAADGTLVATIELAALDLVGSVSGLTNGLLYRFTAVAVDTSGNMSPESAPVWASPVDDVAPLAPVGLVAADVSGDGGGAIALSWSPNAEPDLAFYRVFRDGLTLLETVSTNCTDTTTVNGVAYEYAVHAVDTAGNVSGPSESVTIEVTSPAPVALIEATPTRVLAGQSAVLSWSCSYADIVSVEPLVGLVPPTGMRVVSPAVTTTYTITATGPGGIATDTAVLEVLNVEPLPAGSFGATYEDLIPVDATIEAYDPYRFAVLRGRVLSQDGSQLSGVTVSVLGKPEYGTVMTQTDGTWVLPCDGGAAERVVFEKKGYVSSQRVVTVPWNDAVDTGEVVLVAYDEASTAVVFDGDPDSVFVHESSVVTDARGERTATLVLPGDAGAWTTDEQGARIDLDSLTIRATEFTTPEAMPAVLPPASAFTYCVELSADEADDVYFDRPVTLWVEDFIGFGPGVTVPTGYYDRDAGAWKSIDDGVVVELLDTDGDGVVDGCDVNSDGIADDFDDDGELSDEVQGLSGPRFVPGAVFWRVDIDHFTPYDCNWPWWVPDFVGDLYSASTAQSDAEEDCRLAGHSTVDIAAGVTHEDLPVAGTGATLHYSSSRTGGYVTSLDVSVLGDDVPEALRGILVRVYVAGRLLEQSVALEPNAVAHFEWDGRDWRGAQVEGRTNATVEITYSYPLVYIGTAPQTRSSTWLSAVGSTVVEGGRFFAVQASALTSATGPVYAPPDGPKGKTTRTHEIEITRPVENDQIAEDWTLSVHHILDPDEPEVIYTGDGRVEDRPSEIASIVLKDDDGTVNTSRFSFRHVAVAPDGHAYVAAVYDWMWHGLWRVNPFTGKATKVATGEFSSVAVAPDGTVYACSSNPYYVYRIEPDGTKVPVAGNGVFGAEYENGGSALEASFCPFDVAADADGNVYVAAYLSDGSASRYPTFQITPAGTIHRIAGDGSTPPADGAPAAGTTLRSRQVAVSPDGTVYLGTEREVWAVDPSGNLTKVAGSLDPAVYAVRYSTDFGGTDALDAYLNISDMAVDAGGRLFISSRLSGLIYEVDASGVLVTRAGTMDSSNAVAKWPAPARLKYTPLPVSVSVDPAGSIFIVTKDGLVRVSDTKYQAPYLAADEHVVIEDGSTGHRFSADGRHLETFDPTHGMTALSFTYDAGERLVGVTDRFGQTLAIERNGAGEAIALVSPDGDRTELKHDAEDRLASVTYADGATVSMDYTAAGLITDVTDPRGGVATHSYDKQGRLASSASAEGRPFTYARSTSPTEGITTARSNSLTEMTRMTRTDDRGTTRTMINDAGSVTRSWVAKDDMTSRVDYQDGTKVTALKGWDFVFNVPYTRSTSTRLPSGLTKSTSLARQYENLAADGTFTARTEAVTVNGRTSTIRDDVVAGTVRATSPAGRSVLSHYDTDTLLTQSVEASGLAPVTYDYDARGRVSAVAAGERTTSYSYDTSGNVEAITAPDGKTTSFEYDALGRTTTQVRPDNTTVRFDYDAAGNMTTLVTPRDAAHVFDADSTGARTSYDTPVSGAYAYAYDAAGRLDKVAMPSGTAIDYGYTHDFLTSVSSGADTIALTRAICGIVLATQRASERSTFTYEGSLPITETRQGAAAASLAWTYNTDFAPVSFTYAGSTQTYGYDADGLLVSAAPFTIARRADNALPEAVTAPGFALERSYNEHGEIDSADYGSYAYTLTRDISGRITQKAEETSATTRTWDYTYDTLGRLAEVTLDGQLAESYAYDENGNRTAHRAPLRGIDTTLAASFDTEDRATSVGDATYTYTPDGYLSLKHSLEGTTTFAYSAFGELESVTLADGREVSYTYDAAGRRTSKAIDGTPTQRYLWADTTRLLAVYDGAGALQMRMLYADARVPYAADTPTGRIFFAYDQVGSLRAVTDEAGAVLKTLAHDSFGNVTEDTNPALQIPLGFAGGLCDSDTGLVLFGARDYDPALGRWIAKDPIGFAGGDANLYGYCLGDPVGLVDPSGLAAGAIVVVAVAVIGGYLLLDSSNDAVQDAASRRDQSASLEDMVRDGSITPEDAMEQEQRNCEAQRDYAGQYAAGPAQGAAGVASGLGPESFVSDGYNRFITWWTSLWSGE